MNAASIRSGGAPCVEGEVRELSGVSIVAPIVKRTESAPDAVAFESHGKPTTYGELGRDVESIAAALLELGVDPGDRVALWADRTPLVVAAALAVMRLRAAYVPLDPSYPAERVRRLVDASSPTALLYDSSSPSFSPPRSSAAVVDVSGIEPVTRSPELDPPRPEDAAYVIFTSGSTGDPKGVIIEHYSLLNYASWCADLVGSAGSGAPLFASLGFDHAVTCLWVPLMQGKRVILSPGVWDHEALFRERSEPFTFLKLTPSHARFFERLLKPDYASATETLMFGGEALDPSLVALLSERLDGVRLLNHYGPTEATVGCCWHELRTADLTGTAPIPIGKPVWNSRAYVVDDDLGPLQAGTPGELVMAGNCVARGYLDGTDPGFVNESLLGGLANRAYRTGDVVELGKDGALRYLGRNDSQLKIGGYRIELEEMRHHALKVPAVGEVAFDVRRGDVDGVEAFVVPVDGSGADDSVAAQVREALAEVLPPPAVPRKVHVVDELVFDSHGKCDLEATRRLRGGRR